MKSLEVVESGAVAEMERGSGSERGREMWGDLGGPQMGKGGESCASCVCCCLSQSNIEILLSLAPGSTWA